MVAQRILYTTNHINFNAMKKIILIILALSFCTLAMSRPKALGGRVGLLDSGVSYQYYSGHRADFLEFDLTFRPVKNYHGVILSAVYNLSIHEWDYKEKGALNLYAGIGVGAGYSSSWSFYSYWADELHGFVLGRGETVGPDLYLPIQFGVEYKFADRPLQISLDVRPCPGLHFYNAPDKVYETFTFHQFFFGLLPALGIRYQF